VIPPISPRHAVRDETGTALAPLSIIARIMRAKHAMKAILFKDEAPADELLTLIEALQEI
jgi:hypothetical protein